MERWQDQGEIGECNNCTDWVGGWIQENRSENRSRWKKGWWRLEWQGPVPAEQPGIIRGGKWAKSHAVFANRPGATDDKPDGWQCTVSTLLWEGRKRRETRGGPKREDRELQVVSEVAGNQKIHRNQCERWATPRKHVFLIPAKIKYLSYADISLWPEYVFTKTFEIYTKVVTYKHITILNM